MNKSFLINKVRENLITLYLINVNNSKLILTYIKGEVYVEAKEKK